MIIRRAIWELLLRLSPARSLFLLLLFLPFLLLAIVEGVNIIKRMRADLVDVLVCFFTAPPSLEYCTMANEVEADGMVM